MTAKKYHCRKCGRRFIDWGAEKLNYKCPDCDGEELVRVGGVIDGSTKRPSLRRKVRRPVVPVPLGEEDVLMGDVEDLDVEQPEEEDSFYVAEEEEKTVPELDTEEEIAPAGIEDIAETELVEADDLVFGEEGTPAEAEDIEDTADEETDWTK